MRLLLDTHILIWAVARPAPLDGDFLGQLYAPASAIFFSAASIWEAAIKYGLGRADFQVPPALLAEAAAEAGFVELPLQSAACRIVTELPHHHRDPFDRLLIAQAITDGLTLCTADARLAQYGPCVRLVRTIRAALPGPVQPH